MNSLALPVTVWPRIDDQTINAPAAAELRLSAIADFLSDRE